jgi:outer membrane protein OmpA-like peptidoglycan-associated protein
MAKKNKGFDLGKSGASVPGFDLNKSGDAQPESKQGFELSKSDENTPGFDLNKEFSGASQPETSKGFSLGKGEKEVSTAFDLVKGAQEKSGAASKGMASEKMPIAGETSQVGNDNADTQSSSTHKASASESGVKSTPKNKSKAPIVLFGLLLFALILYFIFGGLGEESAYDVSNLDATEEQVEEQETILNGTSLEDDSNNNSIATPEEETMASSSDKGAGSENSGSSASVPSGSPVGSDASNASNPALSAEPVNSAVGETARLGSISFGQNSFAVSFSNSQFEKIRSYLSENSENMIVLEGHASSEGDKFYNIGLSKKRAQAVKDELVRQGIADNRVEVSAKGAAFPIADNSSEAGRAQNRRVEVKFK